MSTISQLILIGIIGIVVYVVSLWGDLKRFKGIRMTGFIIGLGLTFSGSTGLMDELGLDKGVIGALFFLESIVILGGTIAISPYVSERRNRRLSDSPNTKVTKTASKNTY